MKVVARNGRIVHHRGGRRVALCSLFASTAFLLMFAPALAENEAATAMARRPTRVVEGACVAIELVAMPAKYQILGGDIMSLFIASSDSTFWCGPKGPNPHSWLSPSVICRSLCDFQLVFCSEDGVPIETLDFKSVEPATYRIEVGDQHRPEAGIYLFRYRYGDELVDEFKIDIQEPR